MKANNKNRAKVAAIAVAARIKAMKETPNDKESDIIDLLADIGHLCDSIGLDFDDAIRRATDHLEAEREEEETACTRCGEPTDNGEGWNGLCGNCADRLIKG